MKLPKKAKVATIICCYIIDPGQPKSVKLYHASQNFMFQAVSSRLFFAFGELFRSPQIILAIFEQPFEGVFI